MGAPPAPGPMSNFVVRARKWKPTPASLFSSTLPDQVGSEVPEPMTTLLAPRR